MAPHSNPQRGNTMNKTLIAMASTLLLTGTMSFAASAQSSGYYDSYGRYHPSAYDSRDDVYQDYGRYDDRYDNRYDDRYVDTRADRDRDGVYDRYDRYDDLRGVSWDRDRDGMNDRYEDHGVRPYADRDRDGVPDRYDRRDDRRYAQRRFQAGRYYAPRNYRYVRYDIGSRLPAGYYGSSYYIDYRPYGLNPPPRGYRWNRVGSDAYLVSVTNGLVREVIYSLFY
jgi:Ni/Co efflux regulator RcnB